MPNELSPIRHSTALTVWSRGPRRAAFARWGVLRSPRRAVLRGGVPLTALPHHGRKEAVHSCDWRWPPSVVLLAASAGSEIAGALRPEEYHGVVATESRQAAGSPSRNTAFAPRAFVESHCLSCHNDRARIGGLSLSGFDGARVGEDAELSEKVLHKIRTGQMPPAPRPRPIAASSRAMVVVARDVARPCRRRAGRIPGASACTV